MGTSTSKRNKEMLHMAVDEHRTLHDIGEEFGISRQRVFQILSRSKLYEAYRLVATARQEWKSIKDNILGPYRKTYKNRKRYWRCVDKKGPDECWPWTGFTHNTLGYPLFNSTIIERDYNEGRYAHRQMWCMVNGQEIPKDAYIKRLCGEKLCVNPDHLYLSWTIK